MPVSLPERTVDAWVAAYLATRIPDVLLWAPTQRQVPDYDIASSLPGPGKLFVLEDKAPYTNGSAHWFVLQVRQLWNYLRNADLRTRTFYVLPCPPFQVTDVPGGPGAPALTTPDLLPARSQSRLLGHQWLPSLGCEDWFRVVPVVDLWTRFLPGALPSIGLPPWPKPGRGSPPSGAPAKTQLSLSCPLPCDLGEPMRAFVDRLLSCERPELRVSPKQSRDASRPTGDARDSPVYQALVAFVPASNLPGWTH
jgi:hypothetical protein